MPRAKKKTKNTKKKATERILFDKKKLAFKVNTGTKKKPIWDYKVTARVLKERLSTERRNLTYRTVKLVMDDKTDTFADVMKLRFDWLIPDSNGDFGTDEAIEVTLANCKKELDLLDAELNELGFQSVGLVDRLVEEDRRTSNEKSLSTKLFELGLKPLDSQLNLFDGE
tara:strand:- start:276 stop:782 length:507 start_codon:yes stop_codon:yes gene_type:complete